MTKDFSIKNRVSYFQLFLLFVLILAAYPYVFDRFLPLPSMQIVSIGVGATLLASLTTKRNLKPLPMLFSICLVMQVVAWSAYYVIHNDSSYFTRIFFLLLTFVACFVMHNNDGFYGFMRKYNFWIGIQAVLGFIAFVLVFIGILSPLITSENIDGRPLYFFGITCSNAYYGNMLRSAGFFDEPGALAFWGIYALIINKLFIGHKKTEYALIVGLLSTLSLAYFFQLTLYFTFYAFKRIRSSAFLLAIIAVMATYVYNQGTNSDIYEKTFGRVENMQYGTNRDRMMEEAKRVYADNPVFGVGGSNMAKYDYMGDNPYEILAKDGVVGMFVTYLPLIFVLLANWKRRDVFLAVAILMVGYMQRPFHIAFLHYLMIYVLLAFSLLKNHSHVAQR